MDRPETIRNRRTGCSLAIAALLASFVFFQYFYPYHLMRREQLNLFLFDWSYIRQTYHGIGWLARFAGDFIDQFFLLPIIGPLIVSLLLTAIGWNAYGICRRFLDNRWAMVVAVILFMWSFFRETGNQYMTRYTLAILIYLLIVRLVLLWGKIRFWSVITVGCGVLGIWLAGAPVNKNYGSLWSVPKLKYERLIGMDTEVARENWDKVIELSENDLYMVEASYCYNLAQAMNGSLGQKLFDYTQNGVNTLLFQVVPNQTLFRNCLVGEVWFHMGEMTIAEQSAITSLQVSPNHTGVRFLVRLAKINLITGEYAAAQKYLNLLSKTLFYAKWAKSVMPDNQDSDILSDMQNKRNELAVSDFVHLGDVPRSVISGMLESNPDNMIARNYLLCFDLLCYDLDSFMEDYSTNIIKAHIYQEAVLIWLSQHNRLSEATAAEYGIGPSVINRMNMFFRMPESYRNTYWYYYMNALED